jgi:hypothetical protein
MLRPIFFDLAKFSRFSCPSTRTKPLLFRSYLVFCEMVLNEVGTQEYDERFFDSFAELARFTESQNRLYEAGMAKDEAAIEEELNNWTFPRDQILVAPWEAVRTSLELSSTRPLSPAPSAKPMAATGPDSKWFADMTEAIIANPYAASQARATGTRDPLLPDFGATDHSFDVDIHELLIWEFVEANTTAEQWRTELLHGGVEEAHARKDYAQLTRAVLKVERFARHPEAEIERMMEQMPVYKLAKTEQWKIAALADAAATAVAKAFEKAKRDDEGEKVWEEENLREAIASASASCKNHLGPSWTDWIENGHPLGLTNGQQKLSWSDMSPALDLEKLIFEAAEVANVVA